MYRVLVRVLRVISLAVACSAMVVSAAPAEEGAADTTDHPTLIGGAAVSDDVDQDQARELFERGEIHSLREIIREVRKRRSGEVLGVAFGQHGGRWFYDLEVLSETGTRIDAEVDARTMAITPATNP